MREAVRYLRPNPAGADRWKVSWIGTKTSQTSKLRGLSPRDFLKLHNALELKLSSREGVFGGGERSNQCDRWETLSLSLLHRLQVDKPVSGSGDCT